MILLDATKIKYNFNAEILSGNKMKNCIVKCEFCGDIFEKQLYYVLRGRKKINKDSCFKKECIRQKQIEVRASLDEDKINEKRKQTNQSKYGVDNSFQNKDIQDKYKNTMLEKYGTINPLCVEKFKNKQKNTMLERYGTLSCLEASGRKEEIINILKSKADETAQKGKITCLEKYGVDNAQKIDDICSKTQETIKNRYGEDFFSKISKKDVEQKRKSYQEIIEKCSLKNYKPLFSESDYKNKTNILEFLCTKHNETFKTKFCYILTEFNQCPKCRNYNTSKQEKEISDFIKLHYCGLLLNNDRQTIGKELDIYLPDLHVAIEHHGLYRHCELYKSKNNHKNKFKLCKDKDIKLFQIFGDEWQYRKEICKSMILNMLGCCTLKKNARCLSVKEVSILKSNVFLKENHLMGSYNVGKNNLQKTFGLVENDELYCCVVARPFFSNDKNYQNGNEKVIEIVRFGTKLNMNVRGGFSKLLKHMMVWAKSEGFNKIITYSDCRYSWGSVYEKNGFKFIHQTSPNYYYTDFHNRYSKYRFRAKNGISESERVSKFGFYKIYNAGNFRWELQIK